MTALGSTEVVAATTAASAAGNDEPTIEPSITVAMTTARATDASETGGAASTQATDASETGSAASTQATDASETGGAASTQATDASETAPETASETGASATTEPATAATTAASIASETGGSAVVSTAKSEVTSAASAETTGASAASETDSMATETAAVTGTMSVTEALPTNVLWCKRGDSSGNCPDYQEPSIEKAEEYIGNLRNYQSGGLKNAANQPVFDFYKDYFPNPPPKDAMNLYTGTSKSTPIGPRTQIRNKVLIRLLDGGQTGAQVQANENQGSNVGQAYGGYGEGIFGQDVRPFSMIYQDEDLTRLHFQATSAYYVGQGSGGAMLISPLNDVSKATGAKGRPAIWVTDEVRVSHLGSMGRNVFEWLTGYYRPRQWKLIPISILSPRSRRKLLRLSLKRRARLRLRELAMAISPQQQETQCISRSRKALCRVRSSMTALGNMVRSRLQALEVEVARGVRWLCLLDLSDPLPSGSWSESVVVQACTLPCFFIVYVLSEYILADALFCIRHVNVLGFICAKIILLNRISKAGCCRNLLNEVEYSAHDPRITNQMFDCHSYPSF